jgi:Response regulators consisting of a CheY-like receiver domain and a winged-helix DNA-binding domain
MKKILLVEDESKIANAVARGLKYEGFEVSIASDGEEALILGKDEEFDCIVLDRMLPLKEGVEVCKELRESNIKTPIIMLTAKSGVNDKIEGLDAGADDYLAKPFSLDELLARIRALLRRPNIILNEEIKVGDLILNTTTFEVKRNGKTIILSKKEYDLLEYLMRNANKTISKEKIINHVWDFDSDILPNTVEVYMGYLRNKIDKPFKDKKMLQTVRGFGYKIEGETNDTKK